MQNRFERNVLPSKLKKNYYSINKRIFLHLVRNKLTANYCKAKKSVSSLQTENRLL